MSKSSKPERSVVQFSHTRWIRTGVWLLIWLGMIAAGYGIMSYLIGLPAPRLTESAVGVRGPIVLEFFEAIDEASFIERVEIQPAVAGSWQVEGHRASFWPDTAFAPAGHYQVRLAPGVVGASGRRWTRDELEWAVWVREPQVAFIGGSGTQPEVWKVNADGSNLTALTATGGAVYDFSSSRDGGQIAFSAENAQGGFDLWIIDRAGKAAKRITDCGSDWCVQPSWSREGRLAYIQKQGGQSAGWDSAQIWLVDVPSGQGQPLFPDGNMPGVQPSWSPDGRRIAYYDPAALGVRVLDLITGENLLLPTPHESTGAWSSDGGRLTFLEMDYTAFRALTLAFEVDFISGEIHPLLTEVDERYQYGLPQISPIGERLVFGVQPDEGQPGIQIWSAEPDGSGVQPITNDVTFTHARYRWNPAGGEVLFQRLLLGSSNSSPEIWLWRETTGDFILLAEDASHPDWLP